MAEAWEREKWVAEMVMPLAMQGWWGRPEGLVRQGAVQEEPGVLQI